MHRKILTIPFLQSFQENDLTENIHIINYAIEATDVI